MSRLCDEGPRESRPATCEPTSDDGDDSAANPTLSPKAPEMCPGRSLDLLNQRCHISTRCCLRSSMASRVLEIVLQRVLVAPRRA